MGIRPIQNRKISVGSALIAIAREHRPHDKLRFLAIIDRLDEADLRAPLLLGIELLLLAIYVMRDPDNPNGRIALEDEDFIKQFYQEDGPELIDRDD